MVSAYVWMYRVAYLEYGTLQNAVFVRYEIYI